MAENIKRGFSQIFSFIGIAISIVALIIIIISCILVSHSTKSNIFDRVYEVGVLKSLGADKKSIFKDVQHRKSDNRLDFKRSYDIANHYT